MSRHKAMLAQDVRPGDIIRLVYEIEVNEIGDLDTKFPSESPDLLFINGTCVRGPMRKREGVFAIHGADKLTVIRRKGLYTKLRERLESLWKHSAPNTSKKTTAVHIT